MRKLSMSVSATAAVALTLALASPASADHLADVASLAKPSGCHVGELASGTGERVQGQLVTSRTYADGQPKSYTCLIKNFPKHVDAETNPYGIGFTLGPRGYRRSGIICVVGGSLDSIGRATLKVAGNGVGHLDCTFPPATPA